jgi:hypothetical protein
MMMMIILMAQLNWMTMHELWLENALICTRKKMQKSWAKQ